MIWDGSESIRIKAYKGKTTSQLLADIDNIEGGDEVTVSGYAGSKNDVIWEIFRAGTNNKIGVMAYHNNLSFFLLFFKKRDNIIINRPTIKVIFWLID